MKSCSILIANYNSFEAIQLCIESVRKYTKYPHKIVVFNDRCINGIDDKYLRECRDKGWIELIEGDVNRQLTHGGSLNVLLNEVCDTDYAAVIDCDVQILASGWLTELMGFATQDENILAVVDYKHEGINNEGYRTGLYLFWFGLLNMTAYRDGMQTDWMLEKTSRKIPPYNVVFEMLTGIPKPQGFNEDLVVNDPGSKLWVKLNYDNPKGYKHAFVPQGVRVKYRHYGHLSMISIPHPSHSAQVGINREVRFAQVREELRKLRHNP